MKNFNDLFHPVLAFAIVSFVGIALKGGPEFHNIVCASSVRQLLKPHCSARSSTTEFTKKHSSTGKTSRMVNTA